MAQFITDTCHGLTSEMLGCQEPDLNITKPNRPCILHYECVTPVISGINYPTVLPEYPRGITVSTEIEFTGTRLPTEACALEVAFGSGKYACACEIVGTPDVDESFQGTFKCRPALSCLQYVGMLREIHVEVKGLGLALVQVPHNQRYVQNLYSMTEITPRRGSVPGGTDVIIKSLGGFSMEENNLVFKFNSTDAQCQVLDDTSVRCISPASNNLDGRVDIELITNGFPAVCELTDETACDFVYDLDLTPVVSGVEPPSIHNVGATNVTITGEKFGTSVQATEVTIGGQNCLVDDVNLDIIACTLRGLPAGPHVVEVKVAGVGNAQSEQFIEGTPILISGLPEYGSIYGGTSVTFLGHGFLDGVTFVSIGGHPCNLKDSEPVTLSKIVCETTPAHEEDVFPIQITVETVDNLITFPTLHFTYDQSATPYVDIYSQPEGIAGDLLSLTLTLPAPDILQDFDLNFDTDWTKNSENDWTNVFRITLGGVECPISVVSFPEMQLVNLECLIGSHLSGHVEGFVHVKGIGNSNNFPFKYMMGILSVDPPSGNDYNSMQESSVAVFVSNK